MPTLKVFLSIGYGKGASHEDEIEIPEDEWGGLTEEEKEKLADDYTTEWANNYIDFGYSIKEN